MKQTRTVVMQSPSGDKANIGIDDVPFFVTQGAVILWKKKPLTYPSGRRRPRITRIKSTLLLQVYAR